MCVVNRPAEIDVNNITGASEINSHDDLVLEGTRSTENDENNNTSASKIDSHDDLNLARLSIATQKSIANCYHTLMNSPDASSGTGIGHVLYASNGFYCMSCEQAKEKRNRIGTMRILCDLFNPPSHFNGDRMPMPNRILFLSYSVIYRVRFIFIFYLFLFLNGCTL